MSASNDITNQPFPRLGIENNTLDTLGAIELAQCMLREAAAHAYLRSYKEPGTLAHDTLSTEISKLLTLTRVAMGEALTAEEEAGYGY